MIFNDFLTIHDYFNYFNSSGVENKVNRNFLFMIIGAKFNLTYAYYRVVDFI
jgi:hypothetical protein